MGGSMRLAYLEVHAARRLFTDGITRSDQGVLVRRVRNHYFGEDGDVSVSMRTGASDGCSDSHHRYSRIRPSYEVEDQR